MSILDHRWGHSREKDRVWAQVSGIEPERAGGKPLMVWQAFLDESEKDGLFVVAGYVATASAWSVFAGKWAELVD